MIRRMMGNNGWCDAVETPIDLAVKMKLGEHMMVYPDDRKLDASSVVGAILVSTFPCRKPH
ncbi:MAG: hypothetical protein ACM3WP_08115 [Acidobacteriota bacterium]